MVAFESQTDTYFNPPEPYFWRWQDAGQVICWSDGTTIAFRDELLPVLEQLAADGLPPLGAILLVLAACRDNWHEPPSRRGLLAGLLQEPGDSVPAADMTLLTEVCGGLDRVHQSLTRQHRSSLKTKADICDLLFGAIRSRQAALQAMSIITGLQLGLTPEHIEPRLVTRPARLLRADLQCLQAALPRFNPETLALRASTGLEQQVLPARIEVPPAGTARALISRLQDDPQLGGIARLARRLLSVVQWPRPLEELTDLPCGGVSDIANRGPLDRLLLSELAYDDLTLAARLANGEALYLRREVPPSTPPRQRMVLIDCGIRLWGVPRIFASAVGLALAAVSDSKHEVSAYRTDGSEVTAINLATQEGLIAHLAALGHHAHPGRSLEKWQALCTAGDDGTDAVLVTGEDVLADPEFQRALERFALDHWYVATVNRGGRFRLRRRTAQGGKQLREAQLSLDEVLAPQTAATPLVDPKDAGGLPAFVLQRPLPLLLSRPFDVERAWHVPQGGVLSLTNDQRLLFWTQPSRGALELAAGLPAGVVHCCWSDDSATARAVIGRLGPERLFLLTVDLDSLHVSVVPMKAGRGTPRGVIYHAGFVIVVFDDAVSAIDPQSGELLHSKVVPHKSWQRGRYFQYPMGTSGSWFAASCDGHSIKFEKVPLHFADATEVIAIFDIVAADGPIIVTRSGNIIFPDGSFKPFQTPGSGPLSVVAVSRDGERFVVEQTLPGKQAARQRMLVNSYTATAKSIYLRYPNSAVEPPFDRVARPQLLRYNFRGLAVDSQRRLTLISRQEKRWPLEQQGEQFTFARNGQPIDRSLPWLPFESVERWNGTEHAGLSLAQWPSGDRAILDTRGLVHFQAADGRVPEFTVVLCEGETAGWCADGRWWGAEYFRGDQPATSAAQIFREVIAPFIEGLP